MAAIGFGSMFVRRAAPPSAAQTAAVLADVAGLAALRGKARLLDAATPRRSRELRAAQMHSPFRGRGMEYAESRPYATGDDARHVDWRVSARTGQLHSKLFHAERERVSAVIYDAGPWMAFGTRACFKNVQAARLAALFAWHAQAEGDRLALASNRHPQALLPPAGGQRGVLRLLAQLCRWQARPEEASTRSCVALSGTLAALERILRPGSRLLAVVDPHVLDGAALERLRHLRLHHDLLVALVVDPLELHAPPAGTYPVADGERTALLDARSADSRRAWSRGLGARWRDALSVLRRHGISARAVSTADDPVEAMRHLLRGALFEEPG